MNGGRVLANKQSTWKEISKTKRSSSIKRVDYNEKDGTLQIQEFKMKIDPELEKEIQRAEEAERAIREMEANKGMLNYHRISEKELMDIGSIDSSNDIKLCKLILGYKGKEFFNVDYAEIFEERINNINLENEKINKRINYLIEVIGNNDKTLKEVINKSVSEVQEYVYSLHREIDTLTDKILKEKAASQIPEELLKKIMSLKCKCDEQNKSVTEINRSNISTNRLMFMQSKNIDNFTGEELPSLPNSNYQSFRINTPESTSFHKHSKSNDKKSKTKKKGNDYENFVNSEMPASHRNIMVSNYKFGATLVKTKETGSQIKANFPQIKSVVRTFDSQADARYVNLKGNKLTPKKISKPRMSTEANISPFNSSIYLTSKTSSTGFNILKDKLTKVISKKDNE